MPNNENVDVDGDPVDDVDEVCGNYVDFADVADKVDVVDVGRPQRQVQGAPHEWELEAEPLSLSTLVTFSFNIILLL